MGSMSNMDISSTDTVSPVFNAGDYLPIALVGMGRMGQAIDALSPERNCEVVARLGADEMNSMTIAALSGARVAIEFTRPDAAFTNIRTLLTLGCPVVVGTTGWTARLPELESVVRSTGTAVLWAPNFSVGVQLFLNLMRKTAEQLGGALAAFDAHIVETHHAGKKDAPSGTAAAIAENLGAGMQREIPITSVRVGAVPGTHEVILDSPFEQIRMVHEARDRRVFADGALLAARWLTRQTEPAVYTMQDVLTRPGITGETA